MLRALAWLVLLCMAPVTAGAEGLMGRTVIFNALTYDDPDNPILTSQDYVGIVVDGPEFGMIREGQNGLAVVPVLIDVGPRAITFSYQNAEPSRFVTQKFNGYVLRFPTDCVLINRAKIDANGTTLELGKDAVTITSNSLNLNVSGLEFDRSTRIRLAVVVEDCPLS